MKILAIDTSNMAMGVALVEEDIVKGEIVTNIKKDHSARLMPAIQSLLKDCGVSPHELGLIVVARGPGSYTGVRIGTTIAKTLAWALKIPIAGVSSLEVLAANGRYFSGVISPFFDARRGQIYTGLYRFNGGQLECIENDQIVLADKWARKLQERQEKVLFIGSDIALYKETFQQQLGDFARFAPPSLLLPRPGELALIGKNKEKEDVHTFVPNYVRLAEAEAKWLAKQKGENKYGDGNSISLNDLK
ncbi:tRNA (adenosine(37)-N6)-threonylcarbamoyltransferase complex dimerization subunit type 1 TsaB [Parageobacillus thermoglucosidasius]|uniref:tRNA (adenosine(37)-N6)-threonylcarbamoyltransferase complex dimerization subunit type 1 TsaB n=1 Tax=Parageobacillus thermoglucosidasius TaxID=1426 RepID=UPI000E152830|nr:tRNA (adenosine(37)-N6)-threonylcarbamoyltransferase complex dimerization subunit type 1 TsaB [Parageobacillus thermoglucosidasius]RDE34986.1 tRNA (adenosine(37)-N6)-threonylcarbamoyltransferase complex dimerization subunit type 1 TsaB [Parageobacillus thermoglucosidasius]